MNSFLNAGARTYQAVSGPLCGLEIFRLRSSICMLKCSIMLLSSTIVSTSLPFGVGSSLPEFLANRDASDQVLRGGCRAALCID